MEPQISRILGRLRACHRTRDCQDFGNRKGHKGVPVARQGVPISDFRFPFSKTND